MRSLFGKKEKKVSAEEATSNLRALLDNLNKKSEYLDSKIADTLKLAKDNAQKNKTAAMRYLRKKKMLENQRLENDKQIVAIEQQLDALDEVHANVDIIKALKSSSQVLKQSIKQEDIESMHQWVDQRDEVKDLMDDFRLVMDRMGSQGVVDEDDLMRELDELEQEDLDQKLTQLQPSITELPTPPKSQITSQNSKIPNKEENEDEILAKQLNDWLHE